jgi:uncharacterized protein YfaS (alpha-2-macroglobulin family)
MSAKPTLRHALMVMCAIAWAGCQKGQHALLGEALADTDPSSSPVRPAALPAKTISGPLPLTRWNGKPDGRWDDYDQLVSEKKYQQALGLAETRLAQARTSGANEEWTRSLVRIFQARTALAGVETALRSLGEAAWPDDLLGQTALHLTYAGALVDYARTYSSEIHRRPRLAASPPVDLKSWTLEQIYQEAQRSYAELWKCREQLGEQPVSTLREYIEANTFPVGVRPTLRDSLAYLWTAVLADSSGWRPEHANGVHELTLDRLLAAQSLSPAALVDANVHPLLKIASVLGDLELFHRSRKEAEAGFEPRRVLLEILHGTFTQEAHRERIEEHLRQRLQSIESERWWSMGMATLADFLRAGHAADRFIRAREAALRGEQAFPDSIGGARCRSIDDAIERPSYELRAMAADGPGRRSITVRYKNLARLHFRAFAFDLEARAKKTGRAQAPDHAELDTLLGGASPVETWAVDLVPTTDFDVHQAFVTPPMTRVGSYIVLASAREDFARTDNEIKAVVISIGDLVLLTRRDGQGLHVDALSGETGRLLPNVDVEVYREGEGRVRRPEAKKATDREGGVTFLRLAKDVSYFVLAKKGTEVVIDADHLAPKPPSTRQASATLIYTDRDVYRPGQKVLFKAVLYSAGRDSGAFNVSPRSRVTLSLVDAADQKVDSKSLWTNVYGSVADAFEIPAGHVPGQWHVVSSLGGRSAIQVEEYNRPTFEVKIIAPDQGPRLNKPTTLKGEARYYFDQPLLDGKVSWQVTRVPVFPWWWSLLPSPTDEPDPYQVVAAGTSVLGSDGTFVMRFVPKADERIEQNQGDVSYSFVLTAEVTDTGGETRRASRGFRLGVAAVEAHWQSDVAFLREGQPSEMRVARTNLDGDPAPGAGTYRLVSLQLPPTTLLPADQPLPLRQAKHRFATPDDRLRTRFATDYSAEAVLRSFADGDEKAAGALVHDQQGEAVLRLPALSAGVWRLEYTTTDAFGAKYQTSKDFIVAGERTQTALPGCLLVERSTVRVGGIARVLVTSGLPEQTLLLDIFHGGNHDKRSILTSGRDPVLLEIPVTEKDRGGFALSLTLVRDHQIVRLEQSVFVPWDNKDLKVDFSSFRDKLRPGTSETWSITVSSPAGKPSQAAEVLATMVARSLDASAPHAVSEAVSPFPKRTQVGSVGVSLRETGGVGIASDGFPRPAVLVLPQPDALKDLPSVAVLPDRASLSPPKAIVGRSTSQGRAETAFFLPQLRTKKNGAVSFTFTVPDLVTGWKVWAHAMTRNLSSGTIDKQVSTVKDLLARPILPRFLREGDQVIVKVAVNNNSGRELKGKVVLDILDPETQASLLPDFGLAKGEERSFVVQPGGGADVSFALRAPTRVGLVAFKVTATADDLSDGELRPLPILPGRLHLDQSRFASLKGKAKRTLDFQDLAKDDDPTRVQDQMVITVDGQLFHSLLSALPYLVTTPYEGAEQTLNRFLSTGILSSLFTRYPAVARAIKTLSSRTRVAHPGDLPVLNRLMALEETPWLRYAQGGEVGEEDLRDVLDPGFVQRQREAGLAKLRAMQIDSGAFPWFPGGPASPWITLYLLDGFSKAQEFGIDVPKDMVAKAWRYLHGHYRQDLLPQIATTDVGWEFVTSLNYVLSSFPDESWYAGAFTQDERRKMLDFSFSHWRQHSSYLKGYLALTLKRMGREQDGRMVWDSVLDAAKVTPDLGTFWAPEDRGWLWFNDSIESHAFAIRATLELAADSAKLDGMVFWLLLNKKLNHWQSTRTTAEALYALAHYLKRNDLLETAENIAVTVGNVHEDLVLAPDVYLGKKNQVVIPAAKIDAKTGARVVVEKETPGYAFASATWHYSTGRPPHSARGDLLKVSRDYFLCRRVGDETTLVPLENGFKVRIGDEVEVHLSLRSDHPVSFVHLRDPRAAGFEPTSSKSGHKGNLGITWYEETRDSGTSFFLDQLPQGQYTFAYRMRATLAGTFKMAPAIVQPLYAPEFAAFSTGHILVVNPGKLAP